MGRFFVGLTGFLFVAVLGFAGTASADATIPTRDIAGAKDSPVLKRYEGAFIVSYDRVSFTDVTLPLGALEPVADEARRDVSNNRVFAPKQQKEIEGARTRLVYLLPAERSPLEVLRNYQDDVEAAGGSVLFACRGEACGGDASRSSAGGGGEMSLMMLFVREGEIKDAAFSNGACALTSRISDQRFFVARMPHADGEAHVAVHTYQLKDDLYCKAFNNRTISVVHLVEPRPRDRKMVTVKAAEMARSIDTTGRIALYGVFFDTDKAEIKPESTPAISEIATLLKGDPKLSVLIVGHTDNQGAFDYNVELSRRRADAVVRALVATHRIEARRMRAAGAGMIAPAAANDAEEGRARNRRVEIVKLN